jgi:tagaturonate reductase
MKQKTQRPVTVLQYGEGNFLRGFVDYMIDIANEKNLFNGNVQIVKCIQQGNLDTLKAQDCVYTVLLRGKRDNEIYVEKRVVTCVAGAVDAYGEYERYAEQAINPHLGFIVSNTTEAGIACDPNDNLTDTPPPSFPAKLTKLLYERFKHYKGAEDKGVIVLPVELIEKNGDKLLECCNQLAKKWALSARFVEWLNTCNIFCNTLVDRIITGYPADDTEEWDKLTVGGEPFALWVIESRQVSKVARAFPLDKAGLPVIFTKDLSPYRERKVRVLNGSHTASVAAAFLSGIDTVGDIMKDPTLRMFLERAMYGELSPYVPLPEDEVKSFADSVIERFENPFIQHRLLSIALNSVSKFRVRVMPTIMETYEKTGAFPGLLTFSMAAMLQFYRLGERDGAPYELKDEDAVLEFFAENGGLPLNALVERFMECEAQRGSCSNYTHPGFIQKVTTYLQEINTRGMRGAVEWMLSK